jgi:Pol polyprotein
VFCRLPEPKLPDKAFTILPTLSTSRIHKDDIILDSGCGASVFNDRQWFISFNENAELPPMTVANSEQVLPKGIGTVAFRAINPDDPTQTIGWNIEGV